VVRWRKWPSITAAASYRPHATCASRLMRRFFALTSRGVGAAGALELNRRASVSTSAA